eukprot:15147037-Ditylum_brightwellii.AAC.1
MSIASGKQPNEPPRKQWSMPCRLLKEQPPMTKPKIIKAVRQGSGEQPRKKHEKHKEPREPSAGAKGVLELNMPNDAQEKHRLWGRANALPEQTKTPRKEPRASMGSKGEECTIG